MIRFMVVLTIFVFGQFGVKAQDTHTDIIPVGSTVKKLSSNQFAYTRGAVWYNDSLLLFTDDFHSGADIYQFDPISKQISKWPTNATHCSGLSLDKNGNLIGASNTVIMINKAGQVIKTLASGYNDKPFDNPIDVIADKKGGVYLCDPDFFLTTFPQDKTAVYYIDSIGNVKRVIDDLAEPNGPVLSPDGKKLYVLDTSNKYVYSWDVAPDGSVSDKLSLAELQTKTTGGVSAGAVGMAIDSYGNIYVGTEIGIQVFTPQGVAITTITVPESAIDCDFGGKDFTTLYITAFTYNNSNFSSNLYSIDLNYPGYAVSRKNMTDAKTISNQPSVNVYPNPVSDYLDVQHNLGKVNSIDILSIDGKKETISLRKQEGTSIEINTQNLQSGMYILRIVSDEGIVTRKFVKN